MKTPRVKIQRRGRRYVAILSNHLGGTIKKIEAKPGEFKTTLFERATEEARRIKKDFEERYGI